MVIIQHHIWEHLQNLKSLQRLEIIFLPYLSLQLKRQGTGKSKTWQAAASNVPFCWCKYSCGPGPDRTTHEECTILRPGPTQTWLMCWCRGCGWGISGECRHMVCNKGQVACGCGVSWLTSLYVRRIGVMMKKTKKIKVIVSQVKPMPSQVPAKPQTSPNKPTLNPSYSQIVKVKTSFTPRACDPRNSHVTTCDHKSLNISCAIHQQKFKKYVRVLQGPCQLQGPQIRWPLYRALFFL